MGVWACGCVFCGGMSDAMGSKNRCKTFSTEFFDGQMQSKKSSFSTGSPSRKTQAISYTVGFVSRKRPFWTETQIELSYTVEKGIFRLNFFRLRIPTGGSSRKTRLFRLDPPVEKLSRKSLTRVFLTDRIVHPTTKHTPTRIHGHTPIQGTTLQYHTRR